jgi:hypothetical protein
MVRKWGEWRASGPSIGELGSEYRLETAGTMAKLPLGATILILNSDLSSGSKMLKFMPSLAKPFHFDQQTRALSGAFSDDRTVHPHSIRDASGEGVGEAIDLEIDVTIRNAIGGATAEVIDADPGDVIDLVIREVIGEVTEVEIGEMTDGASGERIDEASARLSTHHFAR